MFTTIIVRPIFNLLVLIYAIIPGHNFGLAVIVFTVLIRLLMWPLVKKQLHQAKAMRELQPELKRIKKEAKGDRQKESVMIMELYKEREINPFASMGLLIVQIPIFIALYDGLRHIVNDPHQLVTFSYSWVRNLSWIQVLSHNIHKFDSTLFGFVDLTRSALEKHGGIYWPAMIIVLATVVMQYYQGKQLLPSDKDSRGLRTILKDASAGKQTDQSEVNAAVGRSTRFLLPGMIFLLTVNIASALSLYWLASGAMAFYQQAKVLNQDESELETAADTATSGRKVVASEVVTSTEAQKTKPPKKKKSSHKKRKKK